MPTRRRVRGATIGPTCSSSWSAQAERRSDADRARVRLLLLGLQDKRYLDFSSQLVNVNIGYQHPKLVAAIVEQAGKLLTVSPAFANDMRSEAARLIAERAPGDLNKVFFTNGGAEAIENAIRMARLHTGRHNIMAAYRSYHGATAGALRPDRRSAALGQRTGNPRHRPFWGPYLYRRPFTPRPRAGMRTGADTSARPDRGRGRPNIAAIILEPVVGTNGILVRPTAMWPASARSATSSASS